MVVQPGGPVEIERAKKELSVLGASGYFEKSKNLWLLLDYVCQKYFEGRSDELKEYNIAIDVFGRGSEFDNKRDSIVRVEAHRLRKRLQQYYENEGADHEIQIIIPSGQYSPSFIKRGETATSEGTRPAAKPTMPRWLAVASAFVFAAIALSYWYEHGSTPRAATAAAAPVTVPVLMEHPPAANPGDTFRIRAGLHAGQHVDSAGRTWSSDTYFTDGEEASAAFRTIMRTKDTVTYLRRREGDFRYDIPLKPGFYELRLYFAETEYGEGNIEGGGESSRLFRLIINGTTTLDWFDVVADASAPNTADVKVFKQVAPAPDGFLHLQFISQKAKAFVNAIEVTPGDAHRLLPIRLIARESGYTDRHGDAWLPDTYVSGGRLTVRQKEVTGVADPGIFQGERFGNFNYAIPVPPGKYTVILHFAETWFGPDGTIGGGVGSRVFNVSCNGVALLKSFDIFKEAGGGFRPLEKRFSGLQPNGQGKLLLAFAPERNYACVNAIEVLDEGEPGR